MTDKSDLFDTDGRGAPPTPNKKHSKKHRRLEIVKASLDVYRVEHLRDSVREQLKRFEEMAKGSDGGKLRPHHTETIREQHYKDWTDRDFKTLSRELKKSLDEFDAREAASSNDN